MGLKIGSEQPKLVPKNVKIVSVQFKEVPPSGKLQETKECVVFVCKHPDRKESVEISTVKYENNGKIVQNATWKTLDEKGLIAYDSALANLMRHYNIEEIEKFVGAEVSTVQNNNNKFLVLKAY